MSVLLVAMTDKAAARMRDLNRPYSSQSIVHFFRENQLRVNFCVDGLKPTDTSHPAFGLLNVRVPSSSVASVANDLMQRKDVAAVLVEETPHTRDLIEHQHQQPNPKLAVVWSPR